MKNLRNLMMGIVLAATLMIGTGTADAGILLSGDLKENNPAPCNSNPKSDKSDWGIVITGFTGIVITGFTGIVITSMSDTTVNCGIVITE